MLDGGDTPVLAPARLGELGFRMAAYPLTLLLASIAAMERSLAALAEGHPAPADTDFKRLQEIVGFPGYDAESARYGD